MKLSLGSKVVILDEIAAFWKNVNFSHAHYKKTVLLHSTVLRCGCWLKEFKCFEILCFQMGVFKTGVTVASGHSLKSLLYKFVALFENWIKYTYSDDHFHRPSEKHTLDPEIYSCNMIGS